MLWLALSKCFLYYWLAQCCMLLRQIFMIVQFPTGFNKHRWLMKQVDYFDQRSQFLFFQTIKQLSSNKVINRKYIINPNEIVFMMCFHKRPLVLCYAFKLCKHYNLFQSFFHTFLYRFNAQNLFMCKCTYFCHLVFPCKSWLCIWLINWNLKEFFLVLLLLIDWKTCSFFLNLVPRTPENAS